MPKPQSPELRRSGRVPALDPDASEAELSAMEVPDDEGNLGSPPDQEHARDQDKPFDDVAEAYGITDGDA